MAEGRGRAQAASLRRTRSETLARVLPDPTDRFTLVAKSAGELRRGDVVIVAAGELIPGDGEVIEGVASVDESAVTGESAPVIRESGGDRSAVTSGTTVLSDWLIIRISVDPGESFLDRMIGLIEAAKRQKTPNEIALDILLAALTLVFLVVDGDAAAVLRVRGRGGRARLGGLADGAGGAAGLPHPDHHRRPALRDRHCRDGPDAPQERGGALGPRGRGGRRRRRAAARQDRHDHARQSSGDGVHAGAGRHGTGTRAGRRARVGQ